MYFGVRRGRLVGQRRCASGAKALPLEGGFIAALKALRHPNAALLKNCFTQMLSHPKAASPKGCVTPKAARPKSCATQKRLPKKQNLQKQSSQLRRGDSGGAVEAGVAAEQGAGDDCFLAGVADQSGCAFLLADCIFRRTRSVDQRTVAQFRKHLRRKGVPCAGNASANHEHIQVENVDQAREQDSQNLAEAVKDAAGIRVALNREVVDRTGAEFRIGLGSLR